MRQRQLAVRFRSESQRKRKAMVEIEKTDRRKSQVPSSWNPILPNHAVKHQTEVEKGTLEGRMRERSLLKSFKVETQ